MNLPSQCFARTPRQHIGQDWQRMATVRGVRIGRQRIRRLMRGCGLRALASNVQALSAQHRAQATAAMDPATGAANFAFSCVLSRQALGASLAR